LKYIPFVLFDIKPVITIDQTIDNVKIVEAAAKK